MINLYRKGSKEILSQHFNSSEFDCPCGHCFVTMIDEELIFVLEDLRVALDTPIKITSGYRCEKYQQDLKNRGYETATGVSTHQTGSAVDLLTGKHTGEELEVMARRMGFLAVGVAKNWIHVDVRKDKERRWTYS